MTFEEVYHQSSATNCTVYCGGIVQGLTDELIQKTFYQFGPIQEIRVFKDKGYAFIKFHTKESATNAIVSVHNTEINGQPVKCSWGKETSDLTGQPTATSLNAAQYYPYWQYAYPQASYAFTQQFGAVQNPNQAAAMAQAAYNPYGYAANPYAVWQAGLAANQANQNQPGIQQPPHLAGITPPTSGHQTSGNLNSNSIQANAMIGGYAMPTYQAQ